MLHNNFSNALALQSSSPASTTVLSSKAVETLATQPSTIISDPYVPHGVLTLGQTEIYVAIAVVCIAVGYLLVEESLMRLAYQKLLRVLRVRQIERPTLSRTAL